MELLKFVKAFICVTLQIVIVYNSVTKNHARSDWFRKKHILIFSHWFQWKHVLICKITKISLQWKNKLRLFCFCRPTLVKGDIAVDFSGRPAIRPSVCPFLIKVFLFANISVSIHRIAFIFYIQLHKDIGNTFPGYFCILVFWDIWLKFLNMVISQF